MDTNVYKYNLVKFNSFFGKGYLFHIQTYSSYLYARYGMGQSESSDNKVLCNLNNHDGKYGFCHILLIHRQRYTSLQLEMDIRHA